MERIALTEKLALFSEHWNPKVIADVDDHQVKLVKLKGEFVWHRHAAEDELFLVLHGRLEMRFRDRTVALEPGELIVVPRGVEHCPFAAEETHVLLFEKQSVLNTGDATDERTRRELDRL